MISENYVELHCTNVTQEIKDEKKNLLGYVLFPDRTVLEGLGRYIARPNIWEVQGNGRSDIQFDEF